MINNLNIFNLHLVSKGRTLHQLKFYGVFFYFLFPNFSLFIILHPLVVDRLVILNLLHYHGVICLCFIDNL